MILDQISIPLNSYKLIVPITYTLNHDPSCTCWDRYTEYKVEHHDPAVKGSLYNLSSLVPKIEFVVTKGSAEKEILLSQASAEPRTSLEVIKTKLHKFGIN